MNARIMVPPKYGRTTESRAMMPHSTLNETIRDGYALIEHYLPARTSTYLIYASGAKTALVWNEGEARIKIDFPPRNGWYLSDGNPFVIPNGRESDPDDPDALYLVREGNDFSGPVSRSRDLGCGTHFSRYVYTLRGWASLCGVMRVDGRPESIDVEQRERVEMFSKLF